MSPEETWKQLTDSCPEPLPGEPYIVSIETHGLGDFDGIQFECTMEPIRLEHIAIVDRAPLPWYARIYGFFRGGFQAVQGIEAQEKIARDNGFWGASK